MEIHAPTRQAVALDNLLRPVVKLKLLSNSGGHVPATQLPISLLQRLHGGEHDPRAKRFRAGKELAHAALRYRLRIAQADVQLLQLLLIHRAGRVGQQALGALGFGEGDDVADALGAGHHGDDAVQAEGDAAMRRGAVLQRVEQEAELGAGLVGADLERGEHLALHFGAVDAHRAAADLPAVEHHVVGLGDALLGGRVHQFFMAVLRRGEGVMHGGPALVVLVELEHREIDHPEWLPDVLEQAVALAEFAVADLDPQGADGVGHDLGLVGTEEQQVAVLRAAALQDGSNRRVVQVLDDGRLQTIAALAHIVDLDPGQAFGAVDLDELGVGVDLAAAHLSAAGHAQRDHAATGGGGRAGEHLEVHVGHDVGEFGELHLDAQIGFVGAEAGHGLRISHDRVGVGELDVEHVFEHAADHGFEQIADFLLVQEGGLAVDLGELGLAVGAQVFVAEALGDLVIAVEARDHEHLLEQLGRLRQGEELAVVHTTGDQVIARAFGRALGEHGGFDVDEALAVEEAAHRHRNPVPQLEVVLHLRTAQVEHAMGQPRGLR